MSHRVATPLLVKSLITNSGTALCDSPSSHSPPPVLAASSTAHLVPNGVLLRKSRVSTRPTDTPSTGTHAPLSAICTCRLHCGHTLLGRRSPGRTTWTVTGPYASSARHVVRIRSPTYAARRAHQRD